MNETGQDSNTLELLMISLSIDRWKASIGMFMTRISSVYPPFPSGHFQA
ncbi:MAG: hypothetical protein AB7E75_01920 [Candidatus Methanomethylophilaceae archaeon]